MTANIFFDQQLAIQNLLHFLSIEGISGQEKLISTAVIKVLLEGGVPQECISFDNANQKIPLPTQTGNLIVSLPGTISAPTRLFCAHLDTVPLCVGCKPVQCEDRIISDNSISALGGDNRTGVTCLVTIILSLNKSQIPHVPLTFIFTVREEGGPWGSRCIDLHKLGFPNEAFNVDGGSPYTLTIGAIGAERWEAEILGRASHAGVHPKKGISATMVASIALADVFKNGWFGEIEKGTSQGVSNVGKFGGRDWLCAGDATNVVTDYVRINGESRSHSQTFMNQITNAYREAFEKASLEVGNSEGAYAEIHFKSEESYKAFLLDKESLIVKRAVATASKLSQSEPVCAISKGGLDANWLVENGIPTVTFGAGEHNIHSTDEYVDLNEFVAGCRMGIELAVSQ